MWRTGEANQHSAWRKGEPLRGSNAFSDPSSACWNGPDGRNISRSGLNRLQRSQAIVAGLVGATYIEEQSPVLRIGGHLARVLTAVWHGKADHGAAWKKERPLCGGPDKRTCIEHGAKASRSEANIRSQMVQALGSWAIKEADWRLSPPF